MDSRLGLGPVFAYEWLIASRRWQMYALRSLLVLLLGLGLGFVWYSKIGFDSLSLARMARVGEAFFCAIVGVQLSILLMAAPAATAGAICQDGARGTLIHLLVSGNWLLMRCLGQGNRFGW